MGPWARGIGSTRPAGPALLRSARRKDRGPMILPHGTLGTLGGEAGAPCEGDIAYQH